MGPGGAFCPDDARVLGMCIGVNLFLAVDRVYCAQTFGQAEGASDGTEALSEP